MLVEKKSRLFCRIDGQDYFDWTVYWTKESYHLYPESGVVMSSNILELFNNNLHQLLDDTFIPAIGSEIHVVTGCPVGMADIRKNYVIKRAPDSGCCNVFSPAGDNYHYVSCEFYAIIPTRKSIVIQRSCFPRDSNGQKAALTRKIESIFRDLTPLERSQISINEETELRYCVIPEAYLMLLKGELKKPCVSYKKLQFKTENELTPDTLYLVYRTGIEKYSSENEEKFKLQLCALNEHNWRDYPGTINILFQNVLMSRYRAGGSSAHCYGLLSATSRIPKAAREMVSQCLHGSIPFKSQKDLEMAQEMVMMLMDMNGVRYTTAQTFLNQTEEKMIEPEAIYRCFDNMIRLTPKKFENEAES